MCLSTIRESYKGRGRTLTAFKQFRFSMGFTNGHIVSRFRPTPSYWNVGIEKSVGPKTVIKNTFKHFVYPAGFHAYEKRFKEITTDVVWAKVRLRGVHTKGTEGRRIVYVARHCKILELLT